MELTQIQEVGMEHSKINSIKTNRPPIKQKKKNKPNKAERWHLRNNKLNLLSRPTFNHFSGVPIPDDLIMSYQWPYRPTDDSYYGPNNYQLTRNDYGNFSEYPISRYSHWPPPQAISDPYSICVEPPLVVSKPPVVNFQENLESQAPVKKMDSYSYFGFPTIASTSANSMKSDVNDIPVKEEIVRHRKSSDKKSVKQNVDDLKADIHIPVHLIRLSSPEKSSRKMLWNLHLQECARYEDNLESHPEYEKEKRNWNGYMLSKGFDLHSRVVTEEWDLFWKRTLKELLQAEWERKDREFIYSLESKRDRKLKSPSRERKKLRSHSASSSLSSHSEKDRRKKRKHRHQSITKISNHGNERVSKFNPLRKRNRIKALELRSIEKRMNRKSTDKASKNEHTTSPKQQQSKKRKILNTSSLQKDKCNKIDTSLHDLHDSKSHHKSSSKSYHKSSSKSKLQSSSKCKERVENQSNGNGDSRRNRPSSSRDKDVTKSEKLVKSEGDNHSKLHISKRKLSIDKKDNYSEIKGKPKIQETVLKIEKRIRDEDKMKKQREKDSSIGLYNNDSVHNRNLKVNEPVIDRTSTFLNNNFKMAEKLMEDQFLQKQGLYPGKFTINSSLPDQSDHLDVKNLCFETKNLEESYSVEFPTFPSNSIDYKNLSHSLKKPIKISLKTDKQPELSPNNFENWPKNNISPNGSPQAQLMDFSSENDTCKNIKDVTSPVIKLELEALKVLGLFSTLSKKFGVLSTPINILHDKLLECQKNGTELLNCFDEDALALLEMIKCKLNNFLKTPDISLVQSTIYQEANNRLESLMQKIEDSKGSEAMPLYGLEIAKIAAATVGCDCTETINFIKLSLLYHNISDLPPDELMKIYLNVRAKQAASLESTNIISSDLSGSTEPLSQQINLQSVLDFHQEETSFSKSKFDEHSTKSFLSNEGIRSKTTETTFSSNDKLEDSYLTFAQGNTVSSFGGDHYASKEQNPRTLASKRHYSDTKLASTGESYYSPESPTSPGDTKLSRPNSSKAESTKPSFSLSISKGHSSKLPKLNIFTEVDEEEAVMKENITSRSDSPEESTIKFLKNTLPTMKLDQKINWYSNFSLKSKNIQNILKLHAEEVSIIDEKLGQSLKYMIEKSKYIDEKS